MCIELQLGFVGRKDQVLDFFNDTVMRLDLHEIDGGTIAFMVFDYAVGPPGDLDAE